MRQITKLERVKYSFRERNEVATLSIVDESTDSRKMDDVGSDAQAIWKGDSVHLEIE